ncbi:MAG: type IV secretory system conjugative DNA transfer family protein [Acidimicrobiales bacterium]
MTPATSPPLVPPPPGTGPLGRFLAHPGATTHAVVAHLAHWAAAAAVHAGPVVAAVVVLAVAARLALARRHARLQAAGARLIVVACPPEVETTGAEGFWSNLVALLRPAWRRLLDGQPHLAFELTWSTAGLQVAIWVPGTVPPGLVERAVEAAWPAARTTVVEPTPPIPLDAQATGGSLRLADAEWYPLRAEHPADPLRALLTAAADLAAGETAAVQILARPVTGRRLARAHRAAAALRSGRPTSRLARLLDLVTPGPATPVARIVDPAVTGDVRAILEKAASPSWAVAVRYAVATTDARRAARPRLRGRAHALASAFALFSGRNRLARRRLRRPAQVLDSRRLGRGDLYSVPELAAVAHLPADVVVPGLARAGARSVAPPPAIPAAGKVLGDADAGPGRPVALSPVDARYHTHLLGATGSGKSTLLTNLVLGDIQAGRGVVVIDPKGDLVVDLLDRLPQGITPVLIDPDETTAPPALNVLDGPERDLAVDNLVGIFRSIFERFWGPRTDDVLRAACLTLLHHHARGGPAATLADVPRLLSDEAFRRPYLAGIADPVGLGGFWAAYEAMSEAQRSQVIGPVMNKLRAFLLRDFARNLVGVAASSFEMGQVLDGGVCLVRVPKGILGDDAARLIGSFVVAKVWQAATARARAGQAGRVDAACYIDEAQNFLTLPRSYDEMLAEARGYRLSLTLAHQHLAQLPRDLREAVSANARNKVFFSVSPEDAHVLARHTAPEISEHDLAHLGAYVAAARLVVAGAETPAFTLRTRPASPVVPGRAEEARQDARAAYGRSDAQRRDEALGRHASHDDPRRRGDADRPEPGRPDPGRQSAYHSPSQSAYQSPYRLRAVGAGGREHAGGRAIGPTGASPDSRGDR